MPRTENTFNGVLLKTSLVIRNRLIELYVQNAQPLRDAHFRQNLMTTGAKSEINIRGPTDQVVGLSWFQVHDRPHEPHTLTGHQPQSQVSPSLHLIIYQDHVT